MKAKKILIMLICAVIAATFAFPVTAQANSAYIFYEGNDSSGAIILTEDCPIEVKNETLTFDLSTAYNPFHGDVKNITPHTVTADYEYYNPTDRAINVKMAFPCGIKPQYAENISDAEFSRVTVDGAEVSVTERFTTFDYDGYYYGSLGFNFRTEVGKISDEKSTSIAEDAPVTVRDYCVSVPKDGESGYVMMNVKHASDAIVLVGEDALYSLSYVNAEQFVSRYYVSADDGAFKQRIVIIGDDSETAVEWLFYENYESGTPVGTCSASLVKTETKTFAGFCDCFEELSALGEIDKHNALTAEIFGKMRFGCVSCYGLNYVGLMRWLIYDMTVPAFGTVNNVVTTTIYPSIRGRNAIYEYVYYLSPAAEWTSFENLTIVINTPFEVEGEVMGKKFTKTESGYTLTLDRLPDEELTFSMRENKNFPNNFFDDDFFIGDVIGIILFVLGAAFVLGVVGGLVFLIIRGIISLLPKPNDKD